MAPSFSMPVAPDGVAVFVSPQVRALNAALGAQPTLAKAGPGSVGAIAPAAGAAPFSFGWSAGTSAAAAAVAGVTATLASGAQRSRKERASRRGKGTVLVRSIAEVDVKVAPKVATERAWRKFGADWEVHKFGGASLETAELYKTCGELLRNEAARGDKATPTAAIVSAAGGMTDALVGVVTASVTDFAEAERRLAATVERQTGILKELVPDRADLTDPIIENLKSDQKGVLAMLTAVSMLRGVPPQMLELVAGLGEVWSAQTLSAYLSSTGTKTGWVDARDVLIVPDEGAGSGLGEKGMALDTITPFWDETSDRLQSWWEKTIDDKEDSAPFLVITGFVCSTMAGRPTTLKRSGSDYSATIFAKVLGSSRVTMWKNVDGVYTADPRRVPAAFSIPMMTFDEAMELAYFGGQVLHPSAMVPCIEGRIPVYVRNVFNPVHPGTRVYGRGDDWLRWPDQSAEEDSYDDEFPVKALTSIEKVALVTLAGASFLGTPGVARRMMEALGSAGVNVILTSQGSSEHSITVAVDEHAESLAVQGVKAAFALELARDSEIRVTSRNGMSIMAVIGEGMKRRPGISGRFFNALGKAKVNVIAIAQGSSERNISAVVLRDDLSRALRAAHAGFTLSDMTMAVGIIGSGKVGTELMKQLATFERSSGRNRDLPAMSEVKRLNIEVRAVCDENNMLLSEHGAPLTRICGEGGYLSGSAVCDVGAWQKSAEDDGMTLAEVLSGEKNKEDEYQVTGTDLDVLAEYLDTPRIPHKVIIDCTADDTVAAMYPTWLRRGIHMISPNKKAGAGPLKRYQDCMTEVSRSNTQWLYESTVGGQMPVINLIHDMLQTGDSVLRVEGILSGTLSYLFNQCQQEGLSLSESLAKAAEQRLTEPDCRDDLSGMDTARKALVLGRELGLKLELEDIPVESLLPGETEAVSPDDFEAFVSAVRDAVDEPVASKVKAAQEKGECLRYVGTIDLEAGTITAGLRSFPKDHPFATVKEAETVVSFVTERYPSETPLVVRGPGAGALLTASGVFGDLLRLSKTLS